MACEIQILGAGRESSLIPSLLYISEQTQTKVLFNGGEGIQRLGEEHGAKLGKLTHLCVTSSDFDNLGGFVDLAFLWEIAQSDVTLLGPPGLIHFILAHRYYVYCPRISVKLMELFTEHNQIFLGDKSSFLKPIFSTSSLIKNPVPRKAREPNYLSYGPCAHKDAPDASCDQRMQMRNPLFYDLFKIYANGEHPDKKLAEAFKQTEKIFFDTKLKPADQKRDESENVRMIDMALSCDRPMVFDEPEPSLITISYAVHTPRIPPKFDPKKADALGVPKGPIIGKLLAGETVTLSNGTIVTPQECFENNGSDGPIFLVVCCKNSTYEESFYSNPLWDQYFNNPLVTQVVHLTPFQTANQKSYLFWCQKFQKQTQHMFVNEEMCREGTPLHKSKRIIEMLNFVDSRSFHVPKLEPRYELAFAKDIQHTRGECFLRYILQPVKRQGYDKKHIPKYQPWNIKTDYANSLPEIQKYHEILNSTPEICGVPKLEGLKPGQVVLHSFGTGAAQPSYHRNVTSMLLVITINGKRNSLLVDAGSGTYGQMYRLFGGELSEILRSIKCIWISHKHADHHAGLVTILERRAQAVMDAGISEHPVLMLGPLIFEGYLREMSLVSERLLNYHFILNTEMSDEDIQVVKTNFLENFGINSFSIIPVLHGGCATALIISSIDGWKIVFSGDTRPSKSLIEAGKDCTLLIHEATMTDHDVDLAVKKAHSTTGEVRSMAYSMNAYRVVLNHFSQRQEVFPVQDFIANTTKKSDVNVDSEDEDTRFCDNPDALQGLLSLPESTRVDESKVIIQMDLMSIDLFALPYLPGLLPVFKEFHKTDQKRTAGRRASHSKK